MRVVSLVFPPLTEATLFPYLSLPVLAAALEAHGVHALQSDANLSVMCSLMAPQALRDLLEAQEKGEEPRHLVRRAVIECVMSRPNFWREVTQKGSQSEEQARSIRLAKRVYDLAIEGSVLGRIGLAVDGALQVLMDAAAAGDLLLTLITRWVKAHLRSLPQDAVLGVSVPFFSQIAPAFWICHIAKAIRPDLLIVLGGPQVWLHFDVIAKETSCHQLADALCFGEGESAIVDVARLAPTYDKPPSIPNVRWLHGAEISAKRPQFKDQIPTDINLSRPPVFDPALLGSYLIPEIQFPLITCVGCYWGKCSFCSYGNRYHAAGLYRELRPEVLEAHCVHIIEKYDARRINFVDENCNLKLVVRAMRGVVAKGHRVRFSVRNRLDKALLQLDFCRELASLGCEFMSVGYETNSQRLLDLMDRGLNAEMFEPILNNLRLANINVRVSVMGAMPQETADELAASVEFLKRMSSFIGIDSAQKLIAEPMTYMVHAPRKHGVERIFEDLTDYNHQLAFGMGRAGHLIGSTSEVTESMFSHAIKQIRPMGNDEKRPYYGIDKPESANIQAVRLLPHAFIGVYDPQHLILGDLSWQDFRKVRADLVGWSGGRKLSSASRAGAKFLQQFVQAGIAEKI